MDIENTPINARVDEAISRVDKWSLPVVAEIEKRSPNARFGKQKMMHMQEMEEEAVEMGQELGLNEKDQQLLRVVNRSHDLGRHIEELSKMDTTRKGLRHGRLSQEVLTDELGFANLFTEQELDTITFAVFWHPELELPEYDKLTPAQKKGYDLAYVLRDMDKEELQLNVNGVLSPNETYRQLRMHNKFLRENMPLREPKYLLLIDTLLKNEQPVRVSEDTISQEISKVINASPDEEFVELFTQNKQLPIQSISNNYANYMLLHIATIFDVKNNVILKRMWENKDKWLKPRMDFLEARMDEKSFGLVKKTVESYVKHKLSE